MAIFYYPSPLSTPASTNFNFIAGDYYINQNGAVFRCATGTGLSAGKLVWPQPTGVKPPVAKPSITAVTLINNNSATRNTSFSALIVRATGGAAIIPTGGTSLNSPGSTPILNFTVSPALPNGVNLTATKSVVTLVNPDTTSNLFNQVELTLSGIPTVASEQTTYTVTFTDSANQTGATTFNFAVDSGLAQLSSTLLVSSQTLTKNVSATAFIPVIGTDGVGVLTYNISPSLPTGLLFNTSNGQISGTATQLLSQTAFTVTVIDEASQTSAKTFNLTVNNPPVITTVVSTNIPQINQGVAITAFTPVTASGGITPLVYSVNPSLPTGLTLNTSTGQISGTASTVSGTISYTITVTDATGQTTAAVFSLTVNAAPITTVQAIASKVLTQNIAAQTFIPVTASGGYSTLTFAISPSLPTGLNFNTINGAITGTPTALLTMSTFTVTVTDQANQTSSKTFSLTVNAPPQIVTTQAIASRSLVINQAAVFTPITASGGYEALTFTVASALPLGLSFSTSTGSISGTPTVISSTATYTITVSDTLNQTSSKTFQLSVINPPIVTTVAVASKILTQGTVTTAFTPITASGGVGALTFAISPSLPSDLIFNTATGSISGTANSNFTVTNYTITVSDTANQTSSKTFNLTVNAPPVLTTTVAQSSSVLTKGVAVTSFTPVTASGGNGTLTYSISPSLPSGLSFIPTTGQITGTPTAILNTSNFTVTVSDTASQTSSKVFSLTVQAPPALISTLDTATVTVIKLQAATPIAPVSATGGYGSISFSISPILPTGLSLSSTNGKISGTPTATTSSNHTITVSDSLSQTSSQTFSLLVVNPPLVATQNVVLKSLVQNVGSAAFIPVSASGGTGVYQYAITPSLPSNLVYNTGTGVVSGTATNIVSTNTFTITITDSANTTASNSFNLIVTAPPPLVITPNVATVTLTQGAPVSTYTPMSVSGGAGTKTYGISPLLPTGLTFNTANGTFAGTPLAVSNFTTYTFTVSDQASQSSSSTFNIEVLPPLIIVTVNNYTNILTQYSQVTEFSPVTASDGSGSLSYGITPNLPTGLTFNNLTGAITGTPTSTINTTTFTVAITDNLGQQETAQFTLVVNADPPKAILTVIAANPVSLTRLDTVDITPITATGGFGPLVYSIDPNILPAGLSFNTSTGSISGTPTEVFSATNFTVNVTDNVPQTSSKTFSLEVKQEVITAGKGYTGSQGFTGSRGFVGSSGYSGSRGFTGSQGVGYTGSKGETGASIKILGTLTNIGQLPNSATDGDAYLINGDLYVWTNSAWTNVGQIQGPAGYAGSQGDKGYTGSQGIGYTGSVGYTGSQGDLGYSGSRGFIGYTGSQGDLGSLGYTGSQGVGYTGSVGYAGSKGEQGLRGYTGSGGGGGGAFGNLDGGLPNSNYGGIASIDAGGVSE